MKALQLEVTLNKIGETKLETPLKQTVTVPLPDGYPTAPIADWAQHFNSKWPKKAGVMAQPDHNDAIVEGLKVLARRAVVKAMTDDYKAKNGVTPGRKRSKQEVIDFK